MKHSIIPLFVCICVLAAVAPASGQVKDAERALKKQEYDSALSHVDKALTKNSGDAKAHELKGDIYHGMATESTGERRVELFGRMNAAYELAVQHDGDRAEQIGNKSTLAYITEFQEGIQAFNSAQAAASAEEYAAAARHFEGCTVLRPDSTGPYVNWAFALIGAGRGGDAIAPLEAAVERGEPDVDVYSYLSRLYLTNDRAEDAVPLLETATNDFPDNQELSNNLLNAYAMTGQTDRAIAAYGATVARSPDNKVYRYNYGALLLQAEQHDAAIEQLSEAVRLDESYTDAQYNLGAAYVNKAIVVNDRINQIDDELRANRSSLSAEQVAAREQDISALAQERTDLFRLAIGPLEAAKTLNEADGSDVSQICAVLFQSYVQTGATDMATTVEECAGYK